jgi:GNAT superfamily N-acetyltransferase
MTRAGAAGDGGAVHAVEDAWLAAVCDQPVFAIEGLPGAGDRGPAWVPPGSAMATEIVDAIVTHASDHAGALYYAKVPAHRIDVVRALGCAGFYVVDVGLTFARPAALPLPERGGAGSMVVTPAVPGHHEDCLRLGGQAFDRSRFHLDPELPRAVADRIKQAWTRSYVEARRGEELLVALLEGRVVGFLAVLAARFRGAPSRVIDLVAVDPRLRGRGIGQALVIAFAERHAPRAAHLVVGTQAANVPAVRLYEKLGFSLAAATHVLHMHVPAPVPGTARSKADPGRTAGLPAGA